MKIKDVIIDRMNAERIQIAHDDFVSERIAIMVWDAGMPESEAMVCAEEQWNKYLKALSDYLNNTIFD
jgi:hypothetical protein